MKTIVALLFLLPISLLAGDLTIHGHVVIKMKDGLIVKNDAYRGNETPVPEQTIFLKGHPGFADLVDKDPVNAAVKKAGTYQYDGNTVRAYDFVKLIDPIKSR